MRREPVLLRSAAACTLILALTTSAARALPSDRNKPIHIQADSVVVHQARHVSEYHGHVRITQGTMVITGNTVTVHHGAGGKPLSAVATGSPATFTQQRRSAPTPVHARASRIEYSAGSDTLHLLGSARVQQGRNVVTGQDIRYDMKAERVEARGGGGSRVHITIQPEKAGTGNSGTSSGAHPGSGGSEP
ncbi:MAG TPA: lipopolysaccharide transport periplasmic protein LptA [Gammaproteobacteria bacterium]|nr:lipopolysaccharide transport periplasmic protein LptA [Gammaproteobacteria bacterium]